MESANPKISVIIPAFNAEATVSRACRSILNQKHRNLEVVVVDDGSSDGTYQVLESLKAEDHRVFPVQQPNGGVSKARNTGLDRATGDYIMFLDADDELAPDLLPELLEQMIRSRCDILSGACLRIRPDGSSFLEDVPAEGACCMWEGEEALRASLQDHPATYAVWGKLYRREAIGDTRFVEGRRLHEDSFFLFQLLQKNLKLMITETTVVHYYLTETSASRTAFSDKFLDILYFAERKMDVIRQEYPHLIPLGKNVLVKANMALLKNMWSVKGNRYKELEKQCQKTIRENAAYFVPALTVDKIMFAIVRLHLFWLFKICYRMLRKLRSAG